MIGDFFNPTRTLTIDRPVAEVQQALKHLYLYTNKYRLTADNELMRQCTYEAYELLSLGVYIEFTYNGFGPHQTQLQIVIRRKMGTFDQPHEITAANDHFMRISSLLSTSLTTDPTELLRAEDAKKKGAANRQALASKTAAEHFRKRPVKSFFVASFMILGFVGILSLLFRACS